MALQRMQIVTKYEDIRKHTVIVVGVGGVIEMDAILHDDKRIAHE